VKEDRVYLVHILETITNIEDLTADDVKCLKSPNMIALPPSIIFRRWLNQPSAFLMSLKQHTPKSIWTAISGFRNRLAHG